jgi:hypothetical protein
MKINPKKAAAILGAPVILGGLALAAGPVFASGLTTAAQAATNPSVNVKLTAAPGRTVGDLGRGIAVRNGTTVLLSTRNIAAFVMSHKTDGPNAFITFYLRDGTKYLNVWRTGAKLSATKQLFGSYGGPGFGGGAGRYVLEASAPGVPNPHQLGLTANGKSLHVAFADPAADSTTVDANQVWGFPTAK